MSAPLRNKIYQKPTLNKIQENEKTKFIFISRWGRRMLTCGPMTVAGVLSLIAAFVPKGDISDNILQKPYRI